MNHNLPMTITLMLLLSGCITNTNDTPSTHLIDYQKCHGTYIDNTTPLVCSNELEILAPEPVESPLGWLCQETMTGGPSDRRATITVYWHPVEDRHAVSYEGADYGLPVSGIAALYTNDYLEYRVWNHGHATGFIVLPELPDGAELSLRWWTTSHESTTQALQKGDWYVNWTMFENRPVPIRILDTGENRYYFPATIYRGDISPMAYSFPGKLTIAGNDFAIEIEDLPLGSYYTDRLTRRSIDTCALPELGELEGGDLPPPLDRNNVRTPQLWQPSAIVDR